MDWEEYKTEFMTDWFNLMTEIEVFENTSSITEWTKPLWFEIIRMHVDQVNLIKLKKDELKEEMYGRKAFL